MKCQDIMERDVDFISPRDSIQAAAQRMKDDDIGFLPVCEDRKVLGTITDRDICIRVVADKRPVTTPAGEVMTHEVVACKATDDLTRAESLMRERQKSRVICTDGDGRLVGVISLFDIARRHQNQVGTTVRDVKK
jgi:CBS domain-containing protein